MKMRKMSKYMRTGGKEVTLILKCDRNKNKFKQKQNIHFVPHISYTRSEDYSSESDQTFNSISFLTEGGQ